MVDVYADYAALAAAETEGVDYTRTAVSPAGATWSVIAPHGGSIEPGSGEMARQLATHRMRFYEFAGIKPSGNSDLHITSTNFDEPLAEALQADAVRTISVHGMAGTTGVAATAVGGSDSVLIARVSAALAAAGFSVAGASSELNGNDPANIANRNGTGLSVQLEVSRTQRELWFPDNDLSQAMRESGQRTAAFYSYAGAVLAALAGRGRVSQGSVNVSRYTLMSASGADIDVVATVSTGVTPAGGSQFVALVGRYADTSNSYLARLEFTTGSVVNLTLRKRVAGTESLLGSTITTGITHAANLRISVRLQITGSTLRARAWLASGDEPDVWQTTVTDTSLTAAGSVGTRSILSASNTNTLPVIASWHSFADEAAPQRFAVVRSVNGIAKSHAAGAAVALADPSYVAL